MKKVQPDPGAGTESKLDSEDTFQMRGAPLVHGNVSSNSTKNNSQHTTSTKSANKAVSDTSSDASFGHRVVMLHQKFDGSKFRSRNSSRRSSAFFSNAARFTGAHILASGLRLELENGETVMNRLMPKFRNSEQEKRFLDEKVLNNLETSHIWLTWMILTNLTGWIADLVSLPGPPQVVILRTSLFICAALSSSICLLTYFIRPDSFVRYYTQIFIGLTWLQAIVLVLSETKRSYYLTGFRWSSIPSGTNAINSTVSEVMGLLKDGCNATTYGYNGQSSFGEPLAFDSCDWTNLQDTTLLLLLCCLVAVLCHHIGLRPFENILACVGVLVLYIIPTVAVYAPLLFFRTSCFTMFIGISLYGAFLNELRLRQIFERSLLANKAFYHNRKLRASFDRHIENEQMLIEEADRLEKENQKLRKQSVMTSFRTVELQSPLMQSIKLLDQLQSQAIEHGDMRLAEQMKTVSKILAKSGSDLTSINITAQVDDASVDLDEVTREWLNNTTSTWQKMRNQGRTKHNNFNRNLDAGCAVGRESTTRTRKVSSLATTLDLDVQEQMSKMHDWNSFDVFNLAKICPRVITALMQKIVQNRDLNTHLPISMSRLMNFTTHLDDHYSYHQCGGKPSEKKNSYHNNEHAADVLQSVECFVFCGDGFDFLGPNDALALYVAAAIHDYRHIGRTNQFLVQTSHPIAIQHNDQSVLERFHLAEAFKAIGKDENNFLKRFSREQRIEVRQTIVDLVLATDLAQTTEYLSRFQLYLARSQNAMSSNSIASGVSSSVLSSFKRKTTTANTGADSNSDSLLLMQITIKVADIGHPTKPLALHIEWSRRIQEEFFEQGDVERDCGLKVAPMCDRTVTDSNKGQMGFIDFVCRPLIEPYSEYTNLPILMEHLSANYRYWQQRWRRKTVAEQMAPVSNILEMETIQESRHHSESETALSSRRGTEVSGRVDTSNSIFVDPVNNCFEQTSENIQSKEASTSNHSHSHGHRKSLTLPPISQE